jgi:ribosomal subunit interface protein
MKISYLMNSVKLNSSEKEYLAGKVEKNRKLLSDYNDDELYCEVDVSLDKKNFFRVEIMIKTPHHLYRVVKTADTLMNATDQIDEVLKKQIRRNKEKVRELKERGNRSVKKRMTMDERARF